MVLRECNNDINVSRQNAKQKPSRARNHHTIQDRVDKNDPYDLDIAACIREFERCGRADCVVNYPSSTQQSKAVSVPSTKTMHANRNERQSLIVRHPIPNPSSVQLDALRNNIGDTCNHQSIPKTPLLNPQTMTMKRPWVRTPPGFPSKSHLRRDDSQTTPYLSVQPLQQRESFSVGQRLVLRQQYETVAGTRFDTQCPSVQQDPNAKNRTPSLVLRNATNENKPAILSSTHHCALARKTAQGTQPRDKKHEILLLTRQGDPISLDQAESFLRKLVHRHSRETVAVLPDLESFTVVIYARIKLGHASMACQLVHLLFETFAQSNNETVAPSTAWFHKLLETYRDARLDPERLENLLFRLLKLCDGNGAMIVIQCWSCAVDPVKASKMIEKLLYWMKVQSLTNGHESIRPNYLSYVWFLMTKTRVGDWNEAETVFWEMVQEYLSGNLSDKPSTHDVNAIMLMYSRSTLPAAPERAQQFLDCAWELANQHEGLCQPDVHSCRFLLETWFVSSRPDALTQAVTCFHGFRGLFLTDGRRALPNSSMYCAIIYALLRARDSVQAEEFLVLMVQDSPTVPNYPVFHDVALSCIGNQRLDRALAILNWLWFLTQLGEHHLRPQRTLYESLIAAFAYHKQPATAHSLLFEVEVKGVGTASHQHWTLVLNAWRTSNSSFRLDKIAQMLAAIRDRFGT